MYKLIMKSCTKVLVDLVFVLFIILTKHRMIISHANKQQPIVKTTKASKNVKILPQCNNHIIQFTIY